MYKDSDRMPQSQMCLSSRLWADGELQTENEHMLKPTGVQRHGEESFLSPSAYHS